LLPYFYLFPQNSLFLQVSEGTTGHAEVVQLVYDPGQISYKELVEFFFRLHDPTQEDGQGNDKGSQYRSVIFYSKKSQAKIAKEVLAQVQEEHFKEKPIVTKIVKVKGK
jgi:peptide-methionine (S)-S-oxide reductase